MNIVLWIITGLSLVTAAFFGKEMLKKFGFMRRWTLVPYGKVEFVQWHYKGDRKPGMYNIVIRMEGGTFPLSPLAVLVGFELNILKYVGFDYFGHVEAYEEGQVVISTYLGSGHSTFQFFVRHQQGKPVLTSSVEDQELTPDVIYPPHWWQRLGFWS